MSLPIAPRHFKRYKEVAFLLLRHWGVKDEAVGDLDLSELDASSPRSHSLAADLERLGPTYVKLGQLLRTRPDLLPPSVYDDLGRLHDDVEAFAFSEAKRIVEEELGARLDTLFSDFEERPLAAASLGQVHRAALRDGTRVAVKVQRPDAERAVKEDLEVLGDVADFLASHSDLESRFGLCSTLREFQDHIVRELDYVEEARNLVRMAELVGDYEAIVVPSVVQDYSSAQVLTMDLIEGTNLGRLGSLALMERPTKSLAEDLFRCYLDQALLHGFVHADPHPGNLILTRDGKLGLVDLGQVTVVPDKLRSQLLHVLLSVAEGDGSDAARMVERIATPLEDYDASGFRAALAQMVAREGSKQVGEVAVGPLLIDLARTAAAHGLRVPPQLGMLGKTLLNLEEVAHILDPEFEVDRVLRSHAPSIIARRVAGDLTPGNAFRKGIEAKELAQALPGRLDAILETAAEGRFRVQIELQGEDQVVNALTRMANRITSGLVLAALIVGASLLMRVETAFTVLGYPGLAILLFGFAGLGAAHLLWRIWRT